MVASRRPENYLVQQVDLKSVRLRHFTFRSAERFVPIKSGLVTVVCHEISIKIRPAAYQTAVKSTRKIRFLLFQGVRKKKRIFRSPSLPFWTQIDGCSFFFSQQQTLHSVEESKVDGLSPDECIAAVPLRRVDRVHPELFESSSIRWRAVRSHGATKVLGRPRHRRVSQDKVMAFGVRRRYQ